MFEDEIELYLKCTSFKEFECKRKNGHKSIFYKMFDPFYRHHLKTSKPLTWFLCHIAVICTPVLIGSLTHTFMCPLICYLTFLLTDDMIIGDKCRRIKWHEDGKPIQ